MQPTYEDFVSQAWRSYVDLTPDAPVIHHLLTQRGERIINDHIAFRTFNQPGISRADFGKIFEGWGFVAKEDLDFPEKKLKATYYQHSDPSRSKIFISELLLERVSPELRAWVERVVESYWEKSRGMGSPRQASVPMLLGESWPLISFSDYERFYPESEYAAWTAAFGVRVNHFTVFVNRLTTFQTLQELNLFLKSHGIRLNDSGGEIKGSPQERLEQSSTVARKVPWKFADQDRQQEIMGCYYEFARRYEMAPGAGLFQGFIPKSADKIFESTFHK